MSDTKLKATDLREKSVDELNNLLLELRKEQFNLRMGKSMGQEVKPHLFKLGKKNIARVKTIINSKQAG